MIPIPLAYTVRGSLQVSDPLLMILDIDGLLLAADVNVQSGQGGWLGRVWK